jgi:hypothetical protein
VSLHGQLGHADDAIHGRADLVAHHREEFALGDVRLAGLEGEGLHLLARFFHLLVHGEQLAVFHRQPLAVAAAGVEHAVEGVGEVADFVAAFWKCDVLPLSVGDERGLHGEFVERARGAADGEKCEEDAAQQPGDSSEEQRPAEVFREKAVADAEGCDGDHGGREHECEPRADHPLPHAQTHEEDRVVLVFVSTR